MNLEPHSHESKFGIGSFQEALEDENSGLINTIVDPFIRKSRLLALKRGVGLGENESINAVEVNSPTLMGMKGQAFAIGPQDSIYYSKGEVAPSVLAHELGHVKSYKTPYGKATTLGRAYGGIVPAGIGAILTNTLANTKRGKILGYGASGLAGIMPSSMTMLQELDAWKYGDRALDKYNDDSLLYTDSDREKAERTKREALSTYATGLGVKGIATAGLLALINKKGWRWASPKAGLALAGGAVAIPAAIQLSGAAIPAKNEEALGAIARQASGNPNVDYNITKLSYAYGSLLAARH